MQITLAESAPVLLTVGKSFSAVATVFRTVSLTLPLPFYRYARERVYGDGELVREQVLEGFILPWPLISALVAYLILALRWRTDGRWVRRILQGRKWQAEERAESD